MPNFAYLCSLCLLVEDHGDQNCTLCTFVGRVQDNNISSELQYLYGTIKRVYKFLPIMNKILIIEPIHQPISSYNTRENKSLPQWFIPLTFTASIILQH